ncbi:MAG: UDP-N-acetylmuramoyl-L-alanine--D-glutamate ligase [Candidatus Krumholzibacteria bacterium]|nr:UDP-N-acetylmuramoyl-L-alanine--D-glutamate ligase [Candidatus Krumholzibacteria bacterium]
MAGKKVITGYRGRRVLVLGLARSGVSAMRLLLAEGAIVSGADESARIDVPKDLAGASAHLGPFSAGLLDGMDEIIVSPGIAIDNPLMLEARSRSIPLTSELELGARFARGHLIGVTGSNGKSTTVTMIGEILKMAGRRAIVCGNVGLPFTSVVKDLGPGDFFVLEISSFQLETISTFRPEVAGILNLTPDHLDRYHDVEDYYRFKARIVENCDAKDTFFYNALDKRCASIAEAFPGAKVPFSSEGPVEGGVFLDERGRLVRERGGEIESFLDRSELGVFGLHNVENALAAVASLTPFDVSNDACRRALSEFKGLPHRMEKVAVVRGVTYYNDSKGTNVEATMMTLKGLDHPAVLIAGGHDKGGDFTKLVPLLTHVKAIVTIGEAAPLIEEAIGSVVPIARAATMQDAVETAARTAQPGEIVLLSPACASFDMFRNFEHRGEVFAECVKELQR